MFEADATKDGGQPGSGDPPSSETWWERVGISAVLLGIALGTGIDLALDLPHAPGAAHIALELGVTCISLAAVLVLWGSRLHARRSLARARRDLEAQRRSRDHWRARAEKLLRGLGEEIDAQLREWGLTPAERETALLLLKGFGHREIGALLGKSERTVRQQAVAVYRKSGLSGRAGLAAFFLEDLLLPARGDGSGGGAADRSSE